MLPQKVEVLVVWMLCTHLSSIEAQKSTGSLHAHSQVVVQRLHQHTSIHDILNKLRDQPDSIIKEYLRYKEHARRQVYTQDVDTIEKQTLAAETEWPEYKKKASLIAVPSHTVQDENDLSDETPVGTQASWWKNVLCEGAAWLQ